jgi:exosortase A-associated hydrolase 2
VTAATGTKLVPFFAETPHGRRFAVENRCIGESRGGILFIHPFAEEMNKSRRMVALTASALSDDGWSVLRFDFHGCGDSEGEFGEATWNSWADDLSFWSDWLRARVEGPLLLWGLRAGALLATEWLRETRDSLPLLLWQPVTNGQRHLTQLLRLRAAANMLEARQAGNVVAELRAKLVEGSPVTVAGYTLNPELAKAMDLATLRLHDNYNCRVSVLETSGNPKALPSPALQRLVEAWQIAGIDARVLQIAGPAFWQTVEIETAPALIEATVNEARELAG